MKLRIEEKTVRDWRRSLLNAMTREIGGVLYGEHVGEADFRVVAFSTQTVGGDQTSFRRDALIAKRELSEMANVFGNEHSRFNYLGEWHSHPNAEALPSPKDIATMHNLLTDPTTNVNFLILIIVRLSRHNTVEVSAHTFLASGHTLQCEIMIEKGEREQ
ncbi:hypothetical protein RHODOSMS8_02447 [Rhodobiaceae bacterium]|nr:hypothetical protein RHODOSMS8_02447 [Rhodobiaceae bacterium]